MTTHPSALARVMVVDDNVGDVELLKEAVRVSQFAYQVLGFTTARLALDHIDAGHPVHLILSDLNMPMMNGVDFFAQVQRVPRLRSIPMAMMSSSPRERLPRQVTERLTVPYFCKGIAWADFLRLAREIDGLLQVSQDQTPSRPAQVLAERMTPLPPSKGASGGTPG